MPNIYLRCSSGFGNKVFDLISAIYLKNKYNTTVYFAIDKSVHDTPEDPFFGNVFYKSYRKIKYIYMKTYYRLKSSLPIMEMWIDNLDKLPEKITTDIRFGGLYRFAYIMYNSFDNKDKELFDINPKLILPTLREKYIYQMKGNYGCVHIRYGDKLCFALEEFKQTKYTSYMLPVYTPQYYIDQINELLKEDLEEILVMTDSIDLVKKYVMVRFQNNPKVVIFDYGYVNTFYLLTKARFIVLSHSTFSFAAAYINEKAVCYLLKKYYMDPEKDYIYEDDAISPNWIIIDNKDHLLNFKQDLVKKMVIDYGKCSRYIKQKAGQPEKKIVQKELHNLVMLGLLTIQQSKIKTNMLVHGSVDFDHLMVLGTVKIYGSMKGTMGLFNHIYVYGSTNISDCRTKKILCAGIFYGNNVIVQDSCSLIGYIYLYNCQIKQMELILDNDITIDSCTINMLVVGSSEENIQMNIRNSVIHTLWVKNNRININRDIYSQIGSIFSDY